MRTERKGKIAALAAWALLLPQTVFAADEPAGMEALNGADMAFMAFAALMVFL